ncbi:WxL domain-containing protein [Lacticaseibacillus sharpeae]|uniref:WxL domain-containing protein n=1 Tax=Lacticaseibacillus sharpeae JCM 1186 = DSM 20505 TaxID=1291052 RepID=A0A0R1ZLE1_9LACO|nr:WxL domain-containing protein [Lacticaseibacillus sharpeae]KRM55832.1 hypothetical protein FC18_GL000882 [Lacticaseibacillus sharpeae JCM 1186 = DSM 20505]
MKKTVLMFATAALAALSLSAVAGNKVSAATKDTTAKITLTADKTSGDKSGDLQLVSAPGFDFGSVELKADTDTTADADGDTTLSVLNPGLAEGWGVTAKATEFTGASGKLSGAVLSLTTTRDAKTEAEGATSADISKDGSTVLNATFGARKNSDGYVGVGTSNSTAKAHISVPAGNVTGDYSSTITWTLTADPATETPADGTNK